LKKYVYSKTSGMSSEEINEICYLITFVQEDNNDVG